MTSFNNFQSESAKHTKNRSDVRNASFNSHVEMVTEEEKDSFTRNLDKYIEFVSWARFYPDLWFDLITPEVGSIRLDLDQRVFLRCLSRFTSTYGVFPRGYAKTFLEVLGMVHTAIFFPDTEISMTAQTKENASSLLEEKWREVVKFYPLIKNEVAGNPSFAKDSAEINFVSGGRIDILANAQSSKGQRRKRLNVEEAALLNNALFEDVLEPIVNIPRRTIGREAVINPEEMNGQINFLTTSGFRGSDEFERSISMIDEMANLKGKMVLGSDWQLAVNYGRGEPKSALLDKKSKLSPTFFAMNYESRWVGAVDGAIVDINKLLDLRSLNNHELKSDDNSEYILSVDVARSQSKSNNQTSIAIIKIKRNKEGRIIKLPLVNLINLPNGLTFSAQCIEVKRIRKLFKAKTVVVDINGLGSGLVDELIKDTIDPVSGESLGCWNTINTDHQPESHNSERIIYALTSQGINHDIIITFIDMVESGKLQLLVKNQSNNYDVNDLDYVKNNIIPYVHTDLLIEEIANLKLKHLPSGKYTIEQVTRRVDKDRYSALAYGLWYIKEFENYEVNNDVNIEDYIFVSQGTKGNQLNGWGGGNFAAW